MTSCRWLYHRLFRSDLYEESSAEVFKVALKLWWEAWNQCPAGSLPNNDTKLRRLADLGQDMRTWAKIKESVLHGFVLCSDDRLYHRLLCEWASDAYAKRVAERERKRRYRARHGDGDSGGDGGIGPHARDGDKPTKERGQATKTAWTRPETTWTGTCQKLQGEDRTGQDRRERKEEDLNSSFSTYPPREAGVVVRPLVFNDPVPPEPPEPRLHATKGGSFASTVNHEPYGPVRDRNQQLEALSPQQPRPAFQPREPERTIEEQLAVLRGEKQA